MYSYYEKCNSYIQLKEKESNVFHQSSKKNEIYPIIFFYEKLKGYYSSNDRNILDIENHQGMSPIHYASRCANKRVLDVLLDFGCDINKTDSDGNSVLHHAVLSSNDLQLKVR